ncbi:hypothetical protein Moror_16594, partial [Moniliophthora roreri MCA 2997]
PLVPMLRTPKMPLIVVRYSYLEGRPEGGSHLLQHLQEKIESTLPRSARARAAMQKLQFLGVPVQILTYLQSYSGLEKLKLIRLAPAVQILGAVVQKHAKSLIVLWVIGSNSFRSDTAHHSARCLSLREIKVTIHDTSESLLHRPTAPST